MASSAERLQGEGGRGGRRAELWLIVIFWSSAFALSSVRGVVAGEIPFPLIAPHRLAVMGFGALLCWAATFLLEELRSRSFLERALRALGGAMLMSALQSLFHFASCRISPIPGYPPITPAEALNSGMVSIGYFTAWSWMHLALLAHRDAVAAVPEPAAPAPAETKREPLFWASRGRQHVRILASDVIWAEAQKDYVRLHAPGGGGIVRETLGSIHERLDPALFLRIHRSAIVRRSEIAAVKRKPSGSLVATLTSGEEVPVGRRYAGGLRSLLDEIRTAP
jgi:hypothetical protein